MVSSEPRRTALYELQKAAGARCINFGGWEMPVQFTSIIDEHQAVRTSCGVFDISHMGEVFVSGPHAFDWLQRLLANDLAKCPSDGAQYTFLLNERGGVIDDLIVYRMADDNFLLLVNAAKITEDVAWLKQHLVDGVTIDDRSDTMSALAVQGPDAPRIFREVFQAEMPARNTFVAMEKCRGAVIAAGTGYTGETGFELFFSASLDRRHLARSAASRRQTLRTRRPRYSAPGDVLSAQRLRPFPRPHPAGGRPRDVCRPR